MSKVDDNMNNLLDIVDVEILPPVINREVRQEILPADNTADDIKEDYKLSRETYRDLIVQGKKVLENAILVAEGTQNPEAFSSVASIIKAVAGTTKEIFELHDKKRKLDGGEKQRNPINVDKAVFIGSPADFLKQIKAAKKANQ